MRAHLTIQHSQLTLTEEEAEDPSQEAKDDTVCKWQHQNRNRTIS